MSGLGGAAFAHELALGLGLAAVAAATAVGVAAARSMVALALLMLVFGAALGAALAAMGAASAGLISTLAIGGLAPLAVLAATPLTTRMARLRRDGVPVGSLAVTAGLCLLILWVVQDLPVYAAAPAARASENAIEGSAGALTIALAALGASALGARALLGFGERAGRPLQPKPSAGQRRRTGRDG